MFVLVIATHCLEVEVFGLAYQSSRDKEFPRARQNRPRSPGWLAGHPAGSKMAAGLMLRLQFQDSVRVCARRGLLHALLTPT